MVEWQNVKYTINEENKEIEETVIGTFTQYPLKLAWAITIHKSQGLTFDRAVIDACAAFAHGQGVCGPQPVPDPGWTCTEQPYQQAEVYDNQEISDFVNGPAQTNPTGTSLQSRKKFISGNSFRAFRFYSAY